MIRTSATFLGALLLLFVHSSSESTSSVSTTPSLLSTTSPTHSTPSPSTPPPSHTPSPSPGPGPSPSRGPNPTPGPTSTPLPNSEPTQNEYILNSTDSTEEDPKVCLRMLSRMAVRFEYSTKNDKLDSVVMPLGAAATINTNGSYCKLTVCAEPTTAFLVIDYEWLTVTLKFDELEGNKHWSYNSTTVSYKVDKNLFKNLKDDRLYGERVEVTSVESLFDWTTRSLLLQSSYLCLVNTTMDHFNNSVVNDIIKVSVSFSDLQVQAFKFTNNGQFDEDESCYADRKIVVPVAVAGALALLASSVLIFSLIKMCWTKSKERRPAKYQRLSANVDY